MHMSVVPVVMAVCVFVLGRFVFVLVTVVSLWLCTHRDMEDS